MKIDTQIYFVNPKTKRLEKQKTHVKKQIQTKNEKKVTKTKKMINFRFFFKKK